MLKVNNLVKDYVIDSDTIRVLDGVNFDVKEGEILGIIGRSGGGTVSYTHLTLPTNREV